MSTEIAFAAVVNYCLIQSEESMSIKSITPMDVFHLNQESEGLAIVDVREADEFVMASSPLAENYPLSTFEVGDFAKKHDKKSQIFMLCKSDKRSMKIAQLLESAGYESVFNIEGGMMAWEASGLPDVRKS